MRWPSERRAPRETHPSISSDHAGQARELRVRLAAEGSEAAAASDEAEWRAPLRTPGPEFVLTSQGPNGSCRGEDGRVSESGVGG